MMINELTQDIVHVQLLQQTVIYIDITDELSGRRLSDDNCGVACHYSRRSVKFGVVACCVIKLIGSAAATAATNAACVKFDDRYSERFQQVLSAKIHRTRPIDYRRLIYQSTGAQDTRLNRSHRQGQGYREFPSISVYRNKLEFVIYSHRTSLV